MRKDLNKEEIEKFYNDHRGTIDVYWNEIRRNGELGQAKLNGTAVILGFDASIFAGLLSYSFLKEGNVIPGIGMAGVSTACGSISVKVIADYLKDIKVRNFAERYSGIINTLVQCDQATS